MSDTPNGRFCWYDLMTTDPEGAKAFYTRVVGWGTTVWDGGGSSPTPCGRTASSRSAASWSCPSRPAPPARRRTGWPTSPPPTSTPPPSGSRELGGKVLVPPAPIPTVGKYAVFADPQGAAFAGFTPESNTPGQDGPAQVGEFSWHELATTDLDAAWAFYGELFDWEKTTAMDMGPAGLYQLYGRKGVDLGGIYKKPPEMPFPPNWLQYVRVPDVHQAIEVVKELGGKVLNGPMEVPGGSWIAQCMDPQGAAFALHHTAQAG